MIRYVYMGTPAFAIPTLEALVNAGLSPSLVVTQPSARRSRGGHNELSPVGAHAKVLGLRVFESSNISSDAEFQTLHEEQPDLIVVVAFGQILRKNVLSLPRLSCINLHPSMLPAYRGAAPIQRAVMDGVEESGISVIKIISKLDAGPILAQQPFTISPEETAEEAQARAAIAGAQMIVNTVKAYASDSPQSERPQDDSKANYAAMLTKDDGLIDFARPAPRVWDQIRGVTPWPRAFTFHLAKGKATRLIIHRARPETKSAQQAPGTITAVSQQGIEVACAERILVLTQLQAEGKPPRDVQTFLNGYRMEPGDVLGAHAS